MANSFESSYPNPALLDQWFPIRRQTHYIQQIRKQVGITQRRAQCFVRLWAYLMLKKMAQEHGEAWEQTLTTGVLVELTPLGEEIPCSHREAAEVFYADSDRGGDRSAGMMIDELAKLKLLSRTFDGNISTIQIRPLANIHHGLTQPCELVLEPDDFNPRVDAVFASQLLVSQYGWLSENSNATGYRINQSLRTWSQHYGKGIRVLRQETKVVGIYCLFPTAAPSNMHFFAPPSNSLYLSTDREDDPISMASAGDPDCSVVFVRGWAIDPTCMSQAGVQASFLDMRQTLIAMQKDFPNLCDLYALSVNPDSEAIALSLGFQKTIQDPTLPLAWLYIPVDQFLAVDIEGAIGRISNFGIG